MKRNILLALTAVSLFQVYAQDDVYYDPNKDNGTNKSATPNYQQQFNSNGSQNNSSYNYNNSSTNSDAYKYDDGSSSSQYSYKNDGYTTNSYSSSNSNYNNNSYSNYSDYDYYYTSQLRRYYTPTWGSSFWDPWYTDLYYYTGNPMYWGNNIYVSVMPSWNWWRPRRTYVVMYDNWGWNNWYSPWSSFGYNNWGWGGYGFNNWAWGGYGYGNGYGWNNWGWGNYNGYYSGYNRGYRNGYYDGMYGNGYYNNNYGWYGKNYDAMGPRYQASNVNSGNNSLPGKYGKTDETKPNNIVVKPGTYVPAAKPNTNPPANNNPVMKPWDKNNVPADGWQKSPNAIEKTDKNIPSGIEMNNSYRNRLDNKTPDRMQPQTPNNNVDRMEKNSNVIQRDVPSNAPNRLNPNERPQRINDMREQMNRDFEPAQRQVQPQQNFDRQQQMQRQQMQQEQMEQQRMQRQQMQQEQMEQQRMQQRQQEQNFNRQQMQPQREMQRFDNNNNFRQMERSAPMQQQPRGFEMNQGGGGGMRRGR